MKILLALVLLADGGPLPPNPHQIEVISAVPACYVTEYQALKAAVDNFSAVASERCTAHEGVRSKADIGRIEITRDASCQGFTLRAKVNCSPQ